MFHVHACLGVQHSLVEGPISGGREPQTLVRGSNMETNALAELVQAHCERTGDTLTDIAARGGMSRQTLSGLVNREHLKSFPRQQTLEALAQGLGVSVESVRHAASTSTYGNGDNPQPRRLVSVLTAYAETMNDSQLEVVLATARAVKRHVTPA